MEKIISKLDEIAEKIKISEGKKKKLAEFFREIKSVPIKKDYRVLEEKLVVKTEPDPLEKRKIIGVDGGLLKHSYHALDLILTKAVASIFEYKKGEIEKINYFPSSMPEPELSVKNEFFSDMDFLLYADLSRCLKEAEVAINVTGDEDILIMDGSIVPYSSLKPSRDSKLRKKYDRLLNLYEELFQKSNLLVGVSEDSRARAFSKIVSEKILSGIKSPSVPPLCDLLLQTKDSDILSYVLEPGERTFVFRYSKNPTKHPILKDIKFRENIYSFYLKTTEFDRPIRVDFYCKKSPIETANKISSLLLPISSQHQGYGIPVVLIEADDKAKLDQKEIDFIWSYLLDRTGNISSLQELRREKRPF